MYFVPGGPIDPGAGYPPSFSGKLWSTHGPACGWVSGYTTSILYEVDILDGVEFGKGKGRRSGSGAKTFATR